GLSSKVYGCLEWFSIRGRCLSPHMAPDPNLPMEGAIRTKLTQQLEPEPLEVNNESHMHAVPPGSESHFPLQRHHLLNETLAEELKTCIHALAIQAKTPQQWGSNPSIAKSPPCMGGSKGDHKVEEELKAGWD
uniref:Uncharacterized protein n=1 Tax=Oncorhynchus tshawytscha TaxID=74940 RepID=A0A8C8EMV3_ONCTS